MVLWMVILEFLYIYIACSDNNKASTVLRLFKEAVGIYGLPSRIRIDRGGEMLMFLLTHPLRGPNRGTVIVGKSTHNQRIGKMSMMEFWVFIVLCSVA